KYTKEFLTIVNSVLRCFLQKYQRDVPPNGSNEMDFVKGLLGILGNISKPPAGRDFLATNEFALSLMTQFVMYLPTLPVPSGDSLKKLLLLPLFNMYSRPGLAPPYGWRDLLLAFRHSLQHDKDQTFHFYYLSIVMNLLFHPPSKDFINEFTEIVSLQTLGFNLLSLDSAVKLVTDIETWGLSGNGTKNKDNNGFQILASLLPWLHDLRRHS
ncbi:unnamed protein product, partial [Timema podura]|nr:unnamed protein product [Timema podura]